MPVPHACACHPCLQIYSQLQQFRQVHAEMFAEYKAIVIRYGDHKQELVLVPVFVRAGSRGRRGVLGWGA